MLDQRTERMKTHTNMIRNVVGWITAIVMLLPFLIISMYNHPVGDDYWCTTLVRKFGYWKAQVQLYDIVPPRYTELALSCLTPLSFGNWWGYKLIPAAFVILFIFIIRYLLKILTRSQLSEGDYYLLAALFTGIYLSVLPGIGEGIYWASALSVYHTGLVLFIIWIGALLKWYYNKKGNRGVFLVACLCFTGIFGCNEIITAVSVGVTLWIGTYVLLNRHKMDSLLITIWVIACLCAIFFMKYQGVNNRYHLMRIDTSGKFFYAAGLSILGIGYYILKCLLNPFFWAGVFAICPPFIKLAKSFYTNYRQLFNIPKYFFSLWAYILFIIFFIMIFLSGQKPPLRISNMAVFFFLLGLIYVATFVIKNDLINKYAHRFAVAVKNYNTGIVFVLLIIGFIIRNNVSVAAAEIASGKAFAYDREMNQRYELIKACTGDSCIVPPLQHVPVTLRYSPMDDDPHISEYFDKKVIVAGGKQ